MDSHTAKAKIEFEFKGGQIICKDSFCLDWHGFVFVLQQ